HGPSIGLTATGRVNFETDTIDLRGTVVPAYAVNSFLGKIPLLGDILVGGEGEGMFAATYHARGPMADPELSVNPLAALAPGFLRGLFDILQGGEPSPPPITALPEQGTSK
ncbi:MAG: AsmA-like C-terminal domain-containing protein, partial [Dongiaceae bacterium]